jgi:hypothetical protein
MDIFVAIYFIFIHSIINNYVVFIIIFFHIFYYFNILFIIYV